ncbi:DedA family protein [Rhodovarius crocodyli]|uniref:DedA family protein n=1 Tax=Rhodovarius crocodyli TaxID=1979269 RepID=A0A437M2K9_9PROT|nr:DedA family protein [Rhodovarius crocodyli]RVT91785.1 DedA family protein [Rhodovarius crocodyli]
MINWITDTIANMGLAGVFFLMFAENVFPPIPSEMIMPFAGFSAARGQMSLVGAIIAGVLGTVIGNAIWFEGARAFGLRRTRALLARFGKYIGIEEQDLDEAQATLQRMGPWAVFLGRMMPGIRTLISVPAGIIEMPRLQFYVLTTLGSSLWIAALTLIGWWLEDRFGVVETWLEPLSKPLLVLMALVCLWPIFHAWRRRRRKG